MSLVFIPKIGDHLRKSQGRINGVTEEELMQLIDLRARGMSHRECGIIMSRPMGTIGTMWGHCKERMSTENE